MDDFDKYLGEQMQDPEFKKEWTAGEAEYRLMMTRLRSDTGNNPKKSCHIFAGSEQPKYAQMM